MTRTFLSAWKQLSIIPILKPEKPSDSPSSYCSISLTFCTSKFSKARFLDVSPIFLNITASFRPCKLVFDQVDQLWIRFSSSHSQSQTLFTNLNQAHVQSPPLWIFRKLLTRSGILPFPVKSSLCVFRSVLSNRYDLISQIAVRKTTSVIPIVVLSVFEEVFLKVQFLNRSFSPCLLIIFLPFFLHLLSSNLSSVKTLPFGLLPQVLTVQLPLSKLPSTDWWNDSQNGDYLSALSSMSHPSSVQTPTSLVLKPLFLFLTPHLISTHTQPFLV